MMKTQKTVLKSTILSFLIVGMFSVNGYAQVKDATGHQMTKEIAEEAFPEKGPYSPWVDQNFPQRPLFGDTHLHTAQSFDAVSFGTALGPEEAYRFARGEELVSSTGVRTKLSRPLDFLIVADPPDSG